MSSEQEALAKARHGQEAKQLDYNQLAAPITGVTPIGQPDQAGTQDILGARYAVPTSQDEFWKMKQFLRAQDTLGGQWVNDDNDVRQVLKQRETADLAEMDGFFLSQYDISIPGHLEHLERIAPGIIGRRRTALDKQLEQAKKWASIRALGVQSEDDGAFIWGVHKSGLAPVKEIGVRSASKSVMYTPGFFSSRITPRTPTDFRPWNPTGDIPTATPAGAAGIGNIYLSQAKNANQRMPY